MYLYQRSIHEISSFMHALDSTNIKMCGKTHKHSAEHTSWLRAPLFARTGQHQSTKDNVDFAFLINVLFKKRKKKENA